MIPARIVVTGDLSRGKNLIGYAKDQVRILERLMSFQSLKQGSRTVKPFPGVVVACWSSFSQQVINIHVEPPRPVGGEEPKDRYRTVTQCPCYPHFSFGVITAVYPAALTDESTPEEITAYEDFLKEDTPFIYDIELCTLSTYVLYEGVISPGWESYYVGQYVLASVGKEDPFDFFDCDRVCLLDETAFDILIVAPLNTFEEMQEWIEDMEKI